MGYESRFFTRMEETPSDNDGLSDGAIVAIVVRCAFNCCHEQKVT